MLRNSFGGGFGPVVRQNTELMNSDWYFTWRQHQQILWLPIMRTDSTHWPSSDYVKQFNFHTTIVAIQSWHFSVNFNCFHNFRPHFACVFLRACACLCYTSQLCTEQSHTHQYICQLLCHCHLLLAPFPHFCTVPGVLHVCEFMGT